MTDTMDFTVDQLAALVPDGASVTLHKGDEPDVPMAWAWPSCAAACAACTW
jgi:hypothetical protein